MKKIIETIKNIWSIEDLRSRILFTLFILAVYRLGSFVVLPGVDPAQLTALKESTDDGLLGLLNMFTGGAFANASIFALGIMPYISASIVIQLLGMAIPYFQKLQKEGESGRRKINSITRYLTILICAGQAPGYIATQITNNPGVVPTEGPLWWFTAVLVLITGTIFVMWLGERITDRGIGNGISLLIMIGIIAGLPQSLITEFTLALGTKVGGLVMFMVEMVTLLIVIMVSILLVQGTRRIPVQYAKRVIGNKQYGGVRQFIPLKVNAAGVMPIIFAQAIMFVPLTLAGFADSSDISNWFLREFSQFDGFWYNLTFFIMVVLFTYFYTAITVNPNQMADDMKKNGGFIPGIKPGRATSEYLDAVMSRITFPGSLFLGFVAILPAFAMILFKMDMGFAQFYGGTSLLILVAVVLDTLQQIESHLLMRHYDGLMDSGRIKGKSSGNNMI
ncbi:MAG: preprotein translocase subunit SecY [Flavobacteriales bacterium]|nr:preprotein translocase subunit SecY [Flavobacteriales bacterium]|tara:strand:+ start:12368 stop:13711 length:1344 start_codon:yes stop_codon:yes gene_type:complete